MVFIPEKVPTQTKVPVIKMIQNIVVLKESPHNIAVFLVKKCASLLLSPCVQLCHLGLQGSRLCFICTQCVFVSLLHNPVFSQQVRLQGSFQTPNVNYSTPFLCLHEETTAERCRRGTNPGIYRPFGFLRIGIYVLGFV